MYILLTAGHCLGPVVPLRSWTQVVHLCMQNIFTKCSIFYSMDIHI